MNIVIPAAGQGRRFAAAGYADPKPFIDTGGQPMIVRVTRNLTSRRCPAQVHWLVRVEHLTRAESLAAPLGVRCQAVPALTQGAVCTVLLAAVGLDPLAPLLVANADQLVDIDLADFVEAVRPESGLLTFPAQGPQWSYVRRRGQRVVEVAEKIPISDEATVGIYYFAQTRQFVWAAGQMLAHGMRMRDEFYLAPVYNELILIGTTVRAYAIRADQMHGLGTPEDLAAYLHA